MGCDVPYYVKVATKRYEWREIFALHRGEAENQALLMNDVFDVVEVADNPPDGEEYKTGY